MNRYDATLDWLYRLEAAKGMDFKLERVELALESLGNPQRAYPSIHVAGTNGKGSVAAMAQSILVASGYRTGLYTSPHLVRFTERIRVDDAEIPEEAVVELVEEIRRTSTSRGIGLTFFELTTVMSFLYFARVRVDAAIVEVGLGGRLDATNVVDPIVSVVTTIGIDHQEYLGDTLEQIAAEKGGILKPGTPVVVGRLRAEARAVLRGIADARTCPWRELGVEFTLSLANDYAGCCWSLPSLRLPFRGGHQRDNAAVALSAIESCSDRLPVGEEAIRRGLAQTRWPGRFEVVPGRPTLILDGAHNRDGVEALLRELDSSAAGRKIHVLFGVMRDKDWQGMARALAEIAHDVTVTTVLPPRGVPAADLSAVFGQWRPTRVEEDPVRALAVARAGADADDIVLVTGSLFLIGAVYPAVESLRSRTSGERAAEAG